jgi:TPR repeat protein
MRFIILPFCLFLLLGIRTAAADDVEDNVQLARAGEVATAVQNLTPMAERGSVAAQYALGMILANGEGLKPNYAQAARWFDMAAKNGNADARRHLAFMRQMGLIAVVADAPAAAAVNSAGATGSEFRVQVASVAAEADAPREWRRLQRRYPDMLGSLGVSVVAFDGADGSHLYRVQGGPLDEETARNVCARLRAEGIGCFVIKP